METVRSFAPTPRAWGFDPPLPPDAPIVDLTGASYPPCHVERHDRDLYRVILGVAGYAADEIEVREEGRDLIVRGVADIANDAGRTIRRFIAPAFERRFRLINGFRLDGWTLDDGMLILDVARDPAVPVAAGHPPTLATTAALAA